MSNMKLTRALLKVQYALNHHAKPLRPVVDALLYALSASGYAVRWDSVRGGNNSWYFDVDTGQGVRRFHVRFRKHPWRLDVKRTPLSQAFASLTNERDVARFVGSL